MNSEQVIKDTKTSFQNSLVHFEDELKKIRTGRANAGMLDGILVDAYGTQMPLNQVASISAPEPQLLQVSPFDPNNLSAISASIRNNQALGLNPMDDGRVIRLPIPPLTEERRHEIVKQLGTKMEESMISLRNIRHEAMEKINQAKKVKQLGEDEAKRLEQQVDEAMNGTRSQIEAANKAKEQEILSL